MNTDQRNLWFFWGALLLTPLALALARWSTGGGHGDYVAARVLVPLACFIASALWRHDSLGWIIYACAIIQIPLEGMLFWLSTRRGRLILVAAHTAAVVALFVPPGNSNFQ